MASEEPTVSPLSAPAAENPTVIPSEEAPPKGPALPEEVLRVPAFSAVLAGHPAAVSAPLREMDQSPEANTLRKHKDEMMNAGIGLYRSLSGDLGVVFNRFYISPEQIKEADKAGTITQIAPPIQEVTQQVSTAGENHPVLQHSGEVPSGFATAPAPQIPLAAMNVRPPAAGVQTKLTTARAKNSQVGSPTSGPRPGAGRILNSVMKRAV